MVYGMREFMPLASRNSRKRVKAIEHELYLKLKHMHKVNHPSRQIYSEEKERLHNLMSFTCQISVEIYAIALQKITLSCALKVGLSPLLA